MRALCGCLVAIMLFVQVGYCAEDKYTWDFGKIKEASTVKHNFILKNESAKAIEIRNVSASCGCTVSKAKKHKLLPGESTAIEVKFNSKGYSGEVKQFVYVETNDLDNLLIRFTIKAEVVK